MGALGCCVCTTTKDPLGNRAERKLQFLISVSRPRFVYPIAKLIMMAKMSAILLGTRITAPPRTDSNVLGSYLTGQISRRFLADLVL